MGCNKSSTETKTHSSVRFQKETGESIHQQLDRTLKALEQKEADTPKKSRRQEIIKIRADTDQI